MLLCLACLFVLVGFMALSVDGMASLALAPSDVFHNASVRNRGSLLPGDVRRVLTLSEVFGHGFGVAVATLLIVTLHPAGRPRIPGLVGTTVLAGLAATAMKTIFARVRPMYHDFDGSILSTFRSSDLSEPLRHELASTPSAHAATAVALAIALTRVYPQGRWLFGLFAMFACLQRITGGAHFLSDVCWGAAIGFAVSAATLPRTQPAAIPGQQEARTPAEHAVARAA